MRSLIMENKEVQSGNYVQVSNHLFHVKEMLSALRLPRNGVCHVYDFAKSIGEPMSEFMCCMRYNS